MDKRQTSRVIAIIPCNDLDAAEQWWNKLGFFRPVDQGYEEYRMLSDSAGGEVHLQLAVEGWLTPGSNPFGVYVYTPRVRDLVAAEPGRVAEHKPWGMYEFALNGPDDLLVRIGWPSRLVTERA